VEDTPVLNIFGYLRNQARQAVLGGIAGARAEVATDDKPADRDALRKMLAALKNRTGLSLWGTPLTDAGLKELAALTNLTTLNLADTRVTEAGVKGFKQAVPKCKIVK